MTNASDTQSDLKFLDDEAVVKFGSLPSDVLASIANQTNGRGETMEDLLQLANAEPAMKRAIQDWKCASCDDNIFLIGKANENRIIFASEKEAPFQCNSCGGKYCARSTQNTNCKKDKNSCYACNKLECQICRNEASTKCGICAEGWISVCKKCQGDSDNICCVHCKSSLCCVHADCGCEECGKKNACYFGGCHHIDWCNHCESRICRDCTTFHSCEGCGEESCSDCDILVTCADCNSSSCNGFGRGNESCPSGYNYDYGRILCDYCTWNVNSNFY